ncbi:phage replication protein (plasmid) [Bacillus thuringiensis serovar tolworthi]|uniref:Phage replication protein n=1 Tax=Bacillus thuringiensis subsp. tolworthi TaxID=1442 RepID=A0A9W4EXY7_BACTO|nr:helix-turn-helix domain-containing protein [Bacillus thuringiensis]MEB8714290.1 helix-turn-helix domain-containing protein [Bacillus cereus]MDR5046520.1 helix-turn-helix domain-containing protein [Bacillus thuringiensis]MEB8859212.1 helix-turn-helix domain-containing protein [Bacillus cereus]MEB9435440.1 helix-turn-helix domain-containing protein [Bacillus cereus]MEB9481672.1 helix-turn-helix domain-containing protein [Bacillus cereus]
MLDSVVQMRGTVYEKGFGLLAQHVMRDRSLHKNAKLIYAYLCSYAWGNTNEERTAFPSVDIQCKDLGMSEDTYYKYRKQLIIKGYITIEKQKNEKGQFSRNLYYIESVVTPKESIIEPSPKKSGMDEKSKPYPKNPGTEKPSSEKPSTEKSGTNKKKDKKDQLIKKQNNKEDQLIHSSSSNIDNLLNIVEQLDLENEEEEKYLNEMSPLFYKSVIERLKGRKIFKSKQQFLDVLKTLQEKNIRIGTMKQVDKSIDEFLKTVEERSQTSNPVQKPAIFYAGRLAMVIERENTVETAKSFIHQNKDDFKGNVLFYNWLEQDI